MLKQPSTWHFLNSVAQVTVDDFFLRYLGTEGLVLELNQARAADFELVGRRQVALSGLLSSKPRIILQREPLISTRDGAVVGYVHVEVQWAWCSGSDTCHQPFFPKSFVYEAFSLFSISFLAPQTGIETFRLRHVLP